MNLSFVIPVYNKEAYVSECINSVRNQTYKDIEIIVVDDGSKDSSLDIINWHAKEDSRVKVFSLKKNMGRSYARNFGNSKAKGDLVLVQDADDISLPDRAKIVYKSMRYDHRVVCYAGFYMKDELGNLTQQIGVLPFDINKVKETKYTYIGHSTMAYNPKICPKYSDGIWSKLGLDDWKFQLDCYKRGIKFKAVDKPVLIYGASSNSISKTRNEKLVDKVKSKFLETF